MYFAVNGITNMRQKNVEFTIDAKNNGGSFLGGAQNKNNTPVDVVLLQDIMDKIKHTYLNQKRTVIVMKMDIERSECRAFLGTVYSFFLDILMFFDI
jgi:hypothetical protein